MYIHELEKWPNFTWNQNKLSNLLVELRHQQGRLIGGMKSIGFKACNKTILKNLTQDVVKSSEIEGKILDQSLVRSSIAHHLGMDNAALGIVDRNIDGIVEMTLDATQNFDQPLTKERLFNWHSSLFPTGYSDFRKINVGAWRTSSVQVVSGQIGKEVVYFEAPQAYLVNYEMDHFLDWFNNNRTIDPVLKAAIAHLWFLTIHPFVDGNGRIGRAIADLMLARSENSSQRFYSLSAQIQKERKNYYSILEQTQKGNLDITSWIEWFFKSFKRAIEDAFSTLNNILQKSQFWEAIAEVSLNQRQKKIVNRMLDGFNGKLTSSKWAKIAKCSQDTAYRDILDLTAKKILRKNPEGGRSTSYSLVVPEIKRS